MTAPRDRALPEGPFDLVVVGGGINGTAIARDAVLRGHSVALLEQDDLASSTSSSSSKMIHGGIRYLERFDFALVFESLRERGLLLGLAPHLVRAQSFLLPLYEGRGRKPWMIRIGLWLYDKLSLGRRLGDSEMLSKDETLARSPELDPTGLLGAGVYWDAVMNDARLVVANAQSAVEQAPASSTTCIVRTRMKVLSQRGSGPITLDVEDTLLGTTQEVRAHKVVYAVGPWSPKNHLRPSKGIHVVLPAFPQLDGLLLQHSRDGRVFFVIPWRGHTVVGTTETPFDGDPSTVRPEADDVRYLLEELGRVFPKINFRSDDVLGAFAGIRPLARSIGWFGARPAKLGKVSRHHRILDEGSGTYRVFGGKFTTFRVIAKDVVDRVFGGSCRTKRLAFAGGEKATWEHFRGTLPLSTVQQLADLEAGEQEAERLWKRYGTRATEILDLIGDDPSLAARLCENVQETRAEVVYAIAREFVLLPSDFLERRTCLRYSPDGGLAAYDAVAEIVREQLPFVDSLLEQDREGYTRARNHERDLARAACP